MLLGFPLRNDDRFQEPWSLISCLPWIHGEQITARIGIQHQERSPTYSLPVYAVVVGTNSLLLKLQITDMCALPETNSALRGIFNSNQRYNYGWYTKHFTNVFDKKNKSIICRNSKINFAFTTIECYAEPPQQPHTTEATHHLYKYTK